MQQRDLLSVNDQMITFSRAVPFSNPVTVYIDKTNGALLYRTKADLIKKTFLDWQD